MFLHPKFATLTFNENYAWWETEPLPVPFFDGMMLPFIFVVAPQSEQWEQAQTAALNFLRLGEQAREKASPAVLADLRFSMEMTSYGDEEFEEELAAIETSEDLWAQVTPNEVCVQFDPAEPGVPFILVETTPTWEEEHGLQLILRWGHELVCLSPNDPSIPDLTDTKRHGVISPPLELGTLM